MTTAAVTGLRAAGPREDGEAFLVDVVVERGGETRRAVASGRDIYAISAPLVVEATLLALRGTAPAGAKPVGAVFDAADLLRSIGPRLEVVLPPSGGALPSPSDVVLTDVETIG
jgi:hypothetical protein